MAQSRGRKPKSGRKRPGATGSRNPQIVPSPKTRLKPLFQVLNEVTRTVDRLVQNHPISSDERLVRFDTEILVRGVNSVKAARLLVEQGHWEHAFGVTRQLFELLINMEHLGEMDDRGAAIFLYLRFGALQRTRELLRQLKYSQATGREVDTELLSYLEGLLDTEFEDFKGRSKPDGTVTWVPSWSRKNTKTLVEASKNRMRQHQYEQLYVSWSEETHATPAAHVFNVLRMAEDGWVDDVIQYTDRKIVETASMTLMLFLQLWDHLPYAPSVPTEVSRGWVRRVMQMVAAPELDDLPGYRVDV